MLVLFLLLVTSPVALGQKSRDFFITSWSYTVENKAVMWTVDDWLVKDGSNREQPWQNLILATGDLKVYARLHSEILSRTNVSLPVLWIWTDWENIRSSTELNASWMTFKNGYALLQEEFPSLPLEPWGIFIGDEPGLLDNPARQAALENALRVIKQSNPEAITYLNMQYASLACEPDYPEYCCCGNRTGSRFLAQYLGQIPIDWISTDEYYDVRIEDYEYLYKTHLYPHLRSDQRVLILPWAAPCEISGTSACQKNMRIDTSTSDFVCLKQAYEHRMWLEEDPRIVGMAIFRLRNLWQNVPTDPCQNLYGTGLGLMDKCRIDGNVGYAMKRTVWYYQHLLMNQGYGATNFTELLLPLSSDRDES